MPMDIYIGWRGTGYSLGKIADHIYYVDQRYQYAVDAVLGGAYYIDCPQGSLGGLTHADIHNPRLMTTMPSVFGAYDQKLRLYLFADTQGYVRFRYD